MKDFPRNNIIEEFLSKITEEEKKEFEKQTDEFLAKERYLQEQGYEHNTDRSYSLKLLNDNGHFPIGITYYACEETFIFRNKKEAKKAWRSHTLGWDGWFYGIDNFKKEFRSTDNYKHKIHWLWNKY